MKFVVAPELPASLIFPLSINVFESNPPCKIAVFVVPILPRPTSLAVVLLFNVLVVVKSVVPTVTVPLNPAPLFVE